MKSTMVTPTVTGRDKVVPGTSTENVVELGLLLPASRAAELFRLARDRHESVGQLIRKLIDGELARTA